MIRLKRLAEGQYQYQNKYIVWKETNRYERSTFFEKWHITERKTMIVLTSVTSLKEARQWIAKKEQVT